MLKLLQKNYQRRASLSRHEGFRSRSASLIIEVTRRRHQGTKSTEKRAKSKNRRDASSRSRRRQTEEEGLRVKEEVSGGEVTLRPNRQEGVSRG